jgi:hypothetical protein
MEPNGLIDKHGTIGAFLMGGTAGWPSGGGCPLNAGQQIFGDVLGRVGAALRNRARASGWERCCRRDWLRLGSKCSTKCPS